MQFRAKVKSDPVNELRGTYLCTVTPGGIEMARKKQTVVVLRAGMGATYEGGSRIAVQLPGRAVVLAISKFAAYQNRLAAQVADYVFGRRANIDEQQIKLEWYLKAPAVLPFGIMILTRGGAIWGGLAGAAAAGCLGLAQVESLGRAARLGLILLINVVLYALIVMLVMAASG